MSDVPRDQIIGARLENNLDDVMEHGPRLSWNRSTWIVARDPERQKVLRGGLGAMGVGQMWFDEKLHETVHARLLTQKTRPTPRHRSSRAPEASVRAEAFGGSSQ